MFKKTTLTLLLATGLAVTTVAAADDWRRTADESTKIDQLVRAMPNTADLMLHVGERYNNLYWAARQEQWDFAAYQAKELRGVLNRNKVTRPGRAADIDQFLELAWPEIEEATASRDWDRFEAAFGSMRSACLACHATTGYDFIGLPLVPQRPANPALHLD